MSKAIKIILLGMILPLGAFAQTSVDGSEGPLLKTPAVSFLTVAPDARSAGMGDVGAATSPDTYGMYWNPGKLAFSEKDYGGSVSYTPWLRHLVNDMWIGYLNGYMKLREEDALGISLQYFNMGNMEFTNNNGDVTGEFRPKELALGATYSRKLSNSLGLALTIKYINSNLSGSIPVQGTATTTKPGATAAVDVGAYWNKEIRISAKPYQLAIGGVISNLGGKISYSDENNSENIPTNFRLGGSLGTDIDLYNSINFALDFNKLLVPTIVGDQEFSDHIKDINIGVGIEYWYAKAIAARLGYNHEHAERGNQKYVTTGIGLLYKDMSFDFAYLIPITTNSPLQNTLRLSFAIYVDRKSPTGTDSIQNN